MPEENVIKLLTANVARVYGFDLEVLKPLAEKYCPTKEKSRPLFHILKFPKQQKLPRDESLKPNTRVA